MLSVSIASYANCTAYCGASLSLSLSISFSFHSTRSLSIVKIKFLKPFAVIGSDPMSLPYLQSPEYSHRLLSILSFMTINRHTISLFSFSLSLYLRNISILSLKLLQNINILRSKIPLLSSMEFPLSKRDAILRITCVCCLRTMIESKCNK